MIRFSIPKTYYIAFFPLLINSIAIISFAYVLHLKCDNFKLVFFLFQHELLKQLLRLGHNCLTFDFIGTSTDESSDDLCTGNNLEIRI